MTTVPLSARARSMRRLPGRVGRRQAVVVALGAATVAVEVGALAGVVPAFDLGGQPVSPSVVPALAMALALGSRIAGSTRDTDAGLSYWVAGAIVVATTVVALGRAVRLSSIAGVVAVSVDEELVYRLALPAALGATLVALGVHRRWAQVAGYAAAGTVWVLLPGHRAQMTGPAEVLSYVAFAAVMALICLRSGSVLGAALAHVCSNLLTIAVWVDVIPRQDRMLLFACVLTLFYLAYGRRSVVLRPERRRVAVQGPDDVVIDLRVPSGLEVYAEELRATPLTASTATGTEPATRRSG